VHAAHKSSCYWASFNVAAPPCNFSGSQGHHTGPWIVLNQRYGFWSYGIILAGYGKQIEQGTRFGELALTLLTEFDVIK
jgi:hypothetical protein